jgi:ubiquinone/menaquinone biosynthesis C-methylase UbiE
MMPTMQTEQKVAKHYGREGLEGAILDALRASGKDIDHLSPADLSPVDEMHLGWAPQTTALAKELALRPGTHLLDIGAGLGGPARYFASAHGVRSTGIDLTREFVEVAQSLTRRCGLAERVSFKEASALALPFSDESFDVATIIHVGMNIADKAKVFTEARRVLRPGGRFGIYDVMRVGDGELPFPMPWAATAETSFVEPPETYRRLLAAAGFAIEKERNRRDFVLELAREMREREAKYGTPPLGPHIVMGPERQQRMDNLMRTLEHGTIAPIEMLARPA